jgi:hypothetical protein
MIRLAWLLAAMTVAAASAHFSYLYFAGRTEPVAERSGLAWLERELTLSPAQCAQVRALHEKWSPQLNALRQQLERERGLVRATGNNAACIAVEDECKACTVTFVKQMTALLTPSQQQEYLNLVAACLPPGARGGKSAPPRQGISGEHPAGR